jgi:two-component system, cell cycle sensor histidine kinase and response regulator CckA
MATHVVENPPGRRTPKILPAHRDVALLIVEDEKIVALDLARTLGDLGYRIVGMAKSCDEALAVTAETRPDLALVDVALKGAADGVTTAALLRRDHDVPVVFLTAYADDETLARARETGAFGYLVKPSKEHDLKAAVEVALARHAAETRLRERATFFSTTLRSVGDAIVAVDRDLAITFANAEAERLTGIALAGKLGQSVLDFGSFWDERTRAAVQNPLVEVLRRGGPGGVAGAAIYARPDGREAPVEYNAAPTIDEGGWLRGAVLVLRDVTRRRQVEEKLIVADRLTALGTLAGGVAHEINNPLTLITNNAHFVGIELDALAEALSAKPLDPALEQRRIAELGAAIEDVKVGARRAASIIEQMRRFSAHDADLKEEVDVAATLAWTVRMTTPRVAGRATLDADIGPLPSVTCNRTRIAQVFSNVLMNATEAIAELPGRAHTIRVKAEAAGNEVVVEISDTGCGMTPEVRKRVFEPFFTTKAVGEGSGLGMAVAHGIVTGLGGRIEIASLVNVGTTVRIVLPVA